MKKHIKLITTLFAATLFSLAACGKTTINPKQGSDNNSGTVTPIPNKTTYRITFNTKGGSIVGNISVEENTCASKPADPIKDGFIFDGWYIDEGYVTKMDFSQKITSDLTLYAKWTSAEVPPTKKTYTVSFNTNGGNSITSVEVEENAKVSRPADPVKDGYTFIGWYTNAALTNNMNFDNPISDSITLYAKWEADVINDPNVGIVDRDFKIPTNVSFSTQNHTSANHTVIDCGSLSTSGSYNQNFDTESKASTVDGVKLVKYRYNVSSGALNLFADNSYYNASNYHGKEGSICNVAPLGGINKIEVSYTASYSSSNNKGKQFTSGELIKPNIRFGNNPECKDYVYFLNPTSTSETCNVNLSGYKYFSVNTGSYYLSLSTITVDYDNDSVSSPSYAATSGQGKTRINPIRYTYNLVAGESKITVPTKTAFNTATNSYVVTESKELTYYTTSYVSNHPECVDDAALIDPLLISAYYTTFGEWPANFALKDDLSVVKNVFGSKARQVSRYDRTDGYATAVPYRNESGKNKPVYYEFDIDLDGSYGTSSRGVGRVVGWKPGWNVDGYDGAPVCVYTDDHYNTFAEYLNNGSWSSRFNAEGVVAGIKYSSASTVSLSNFDPHMVEGTSQGGGGQGGGGNQQGGGDEQKLIDDNDYYANFAPEELINENTAKYQRVTNASGINESNAYTFVCSTNGVRTFPVQPQMNINSSDHSLELEYEGEKQYIEYMYFELVSDRTCYVYRMNYGEKVYLGFNSSAKTKDIIDNRKTLYNFSFDAYGNFNLYSDGFYLRNNPSVNIPGFRFYGQGSQNPIQLYRLCDVEGATPIEINYLDTEFELVTSVSNISNTDAYILVSEKSKKALYCAGTYFVDSTTKELKATDDSYLNVLTIQKDETYNLYKVARGWWYLSYRSDINYLDYDSEPTYFDIAIYNGIVKFVPMNIEGSTPEPYYINGEVCFIGIDPLIQEFGIASGESNSDTRLYRVVPKIRTEYSMVGSTTYLNEEHDLILVSDDGQCCLTDDSDAVYTINGYELSIEGTPNYKVLHFSKHETEDVYSISYEDNGVTKYLGVHIDADTYDVYESDEPCYFVVEIYGDYSVRIEPAIVHPTLNYYVGISYEWEVCRLKYNPDEDCFMLCRYDIDTKEYLFEVSEREYY